MSTSALLLIALASVVLLLLLVIKAKAHPFVALLIVSLLVAFAAGIPADKIITTIEKGMGGLLGHIASIIILGSMLGVLIEMSGGAESLAKTLTGVLGAKRTIAALTIVAFILGTPVFFEVGFIIIIPLIYGFQQSRPRVAVEVWPADGRRDVNRPRGAAHPSWRSGCGRHSA